MVRRSFAFAYLLIVTHLAHGSGYIRIHAFDKEYFQLHTEFDNLEALMREVAGKGKEISIQ